MKTIKTIFVLITIVLLTFTACDNPLQEKTYTTLSPNDFFNTAEDVEVVLNSAYAQFYYLRYHWNIMVFQEMTTDHYLERKGGVNTFVDPIQNFVWTPSNTLFDQYWERWYKSIYNTNVVLDNISSVEMNEDKREELMGEARFIRAYNYYLLYDLFGPVPLITSSETGVEDRPGRATEEEIVSFMESEFRAASEVLPLDSPGNQYGRATKGAALGVLTKLHMMENNWQQAADNAKEVMDLGIYDLFTEGHRSELFGPENEGDNEFIFVLPFTSEGGNSTGNEILSFIVPDNYPWKYPPRVIFAAEIRVRPELLEKFDPGDERYDVFLFEYVSTNGDSIKLGEDEVRSFKFPEYPDQRNFVDGNDMPIIRYADILLSRAEALNELMGPNQESVDLLNMVRDAAGVSTFTLGDFSSMEEFRNFILDERSREFHQEAMKRQDLIRHGKFIEMARQRGKPAMDYHVRFPIPQSEIERNPNLVQNDGY